jgi:hypothetical protein
MLWDKQNIGKEEDNGLMHVRYDATDRFVALMDDTAGY